jgi:hypothetical protein
MSDSADSALFALALIVGIVLASVAASSLVLVFVRRRFLAQRAWPLMLLVTISCLPAMDNVIPFILNQSEVPCTHTYILNTLGVTGAAVGVCALGFRLDRLFAVEKQKARIAKAATAK